MFLDEAKRALKDPFMQGAILGIATYGALLIVAQKTLSPNMPPMCLNLSKEASDMLLKGEPLYFDFSAPVGTLVLSLSKIITP